MQKKAGGFHRVPEIYPFDNYLLGIVLAIEDKTVNKMDKNLYTHGDYVLLEEDREKKQTK